MPLTSSVTSFAAGLNGPISRILPSRMRTFANARGFPVPSITEPLTRTRSSASRGSEISKLKTMTEIVRMIAEYYVKPEGRDENYSIRSLCRGEQDLIWNSGRRQHTRASRRFIQSSGAGRQDRAIVGRQAARAMFSIEGRLCRQELQKPYRGSWARACEGTRHFLETDFKHHRNGREYCVSGRRQQCALRSGAGCRHREGRKKHCRGRCIETHLRHYGWKRCEREGLAEKRSAMVPGQRLGYLRRAWPVHCSGFELQRSAGAGPFERRGCAVATDEGSHFCGRY